MKYLRKTCLEFAGIYYKEVQEFGKKRYKNDFSPSWCKDPCVKNIGGIANKSG